MLLSWYVTLPQLLSMDMFAGKDCWQVSVTEVHC
jgi:hypothetical protein